MTDLRRIGFQRPAGATFAVDTGKRTITGLLVPYGVVAASNGENWTFSQGSLSYGDVSRVKLWVNHDVAQAVGVATSLDDQADGMYGSFYVAPTPEGDNALTMAASGVWDGFSIGIAPGGTFSRDEDGVLHAAPAGAPLMEVSLTPAPAFDDARVHSVAASAASTHKEPHMAEDDLTTAGTEADIVAGTITGNVTITPTAPPADSGADQPASDVAAAVAAALPAALATFGISAGGRQVVPAAGPGATRPTAQVTEPAPYRFDGTRGAYEFSSDLAAALGLGALNPAPNHEAYARVMTFMRSELRPERMAQGPQFVTTTDTAAVNPTQYRPDMFVNEQRFTTPLYDEFYKGGLTDATPFTFAKFNTASGLVGDHTQGTEPTPGSYSTAAGATITPAPVSGKVHITREVGDQGGNPQISALLWDKITYEYRKAMETKVAALLAAASPAEFPTTLAAGANTVATLATPLEQAIMRLNFQAGGNRYSYAAAHLDLYLALGGLKDGDSRPYYPIIGATNANGTTTGGYPSLNVSGTRFDPVWSLGTTSDGTAHKSYLADPSAIWFWASAPVKLDRLQEKVEGWDLGVWGYQAGVISDATGLLKITYDPTV